MGDAPTPAPRSRRHTILFVTAVIVVILVALTVAATIYTETLWFREVGYSSVFSTMLRTRIALGAVFGGAFGILLLVNLWVVRKITPPERASRVPEQILRRYRASLAPLKKPALAGLALIGASAAGMRASSMWREYLLWRHPATFGRPDPVFGKDAGFYVFKLTFLRFVFGWTFAVLLTVTILVALSHYFRGGIRPQRRGERVGVEVRAHLSILIGLIVLLKAWGYRLDQLNLFSSTRGVVNGAGYTDVHATLPALRVLVVVAIVAAAMLFANVRFRTWKLPVIGIGLLAGVSIVGGGIVPAAVQRLKVNPDERTLEAPYLRRNIEATRYAYALEGVTTQQYPTSGSLDLGSAVANRDVIGNVRVWAPDVLQSVYLNLQRGKQYYQFVSPADTDRYGVAGSLQQLMIAAREISPNGLSPDAKTWVNTHLFYTHGYAAVASRAAGVVNQGQPGFVIRNIPPVSAAGTPPVSVSQLYYGENEEVPFVVVATKQGELDYPTSDSLGRVGYVTTTYDGTGGIPLDGFIKRAAFAWRFRDLNLLLSGSITDRSRIMFRRQITNRVARVAPFLSIDGDPYIAVVNGRLVWIVDGYTTSARYPYSQPANFGTTSSGLVSGSGNYIRDSVKFLVDAKDGTVDGYVWDETDPVLKAWLNIFPGIFKPRSQVPLGALLHVRYPEGFFQIQSDRFANYHVTDPGSFYQKEDAWLIGRDATYCLNNSGTCRGSTVAPPVPAYYMLARLPGDAVLRFVLVRPFTPGGSGRQNMVAYLVANSDVGRYGTLVDYEFRTQQVFGPEQVQANINQDPAVSQQIALWNQQHSKVIYGNLVIVPIGDTLMYVQPLYLRGEGSQIPELKRVVVVANGEVRMADTLPDAIALLLGRAIFPTP